MPKWFEKILKYNPGEKSLRAPFAIYLDLECLLKKEQSCQNNPEKSYTEKKAKHEPSGWAMFTKYSFDETENYYRGKDCIEKLCKKLKKHAMKIINYGEKEMIPLTDEENNSSEQQEACHICTEIFCADEDDEHYKNKKGLKITVITQESLEGLFICNLSYKFPKNIPIIIHNASYDTHFIINQLTKEFKGELDCIGENMEKYITFSAPIKKKCDDGKTITYKLRFIDSFRFMPTSLSELVDNTSGIFNSIECKSCIEKIKINSECCFVGLKNNRLIYRCKECKKEWKRPIEGLIRKFPIYINFAMAI